MPPPSVACPSPSTRPSWRGWSAAWPGRNIPTNRGPGAAEPVAILTNPFRARGIPGLDGAVSQDPTAVLRLLSRCPEAAPTALRSLPSLASELPVDRLWVKDESSRMGLGSFKALGAAYLIAAEAAESETGRLDGVTYVAASAGNHGLSLAAGARTFGAKGVVFISENVREHFADRLEAQGAEVVRAGADYEESMAAAARA